MHAKSNTIVEIQALRAIAVLLVVFYHGNIATFAGGYIGVDIFFVISGYLITSLLVRERNRSGEIKLFNFYARRIRRLLPAAAVMISVTAAVCWFSYSPLQLKQFTSSAIASATYLSNFWFFQIATDYLASEPHTNPLLHTWSLSVEEQFYVFWPILIIALSRASGVDGVSRRLMYGIVGLSLVSLSLCVIQTKTNQPLAFFGTQARAWEFGFGGILAVVHSKPILLAAATRNFLFSVGLLLIVAPAVAFNDETAFPGFAAIWPVLGTVFIIHSCYGAISPGFAGWMKNKQIQYFGDISYSLYLWHWPTVLLLNDLNLSSNTVSVALYFTISLLLASSSYYLVENPIRFNRALARKPAQSYTIGLIVSVILIGGLFFARYSTTQELAKETQVSYRHAALDNPPVYADGCHLDWYSVIIPKNCVYGAKNASRSIVIFGDSHATHWFPALNTIALKLNYRLLSLTKSGCPSIIIEPFSASLKRQYTECTQWRTSALKLIARSDPELVVLSNSDAYMLKHGGEEPQVDDDRLTAGVTQIAERLQDLRGNFVIIRDTPSLAFDPLNCLSRAAWKETDPSLDCSFSIDDPMKENIFSAVRKIVATTQNGNVIDMNLEICAGRNKCALEQEGVVIYRDRDHLTRTFARNSSDALLQRLQALHLLSLAQ